MESEWARWLAALGILVLGGAVLFWLGTQVRRRAVRRVRSDDTVGMICRVLVRTRPVLLTLLALPLASLALEMPEHLRGWIGAFTIAVVLAQAGSWGSAAIGVWVTRYQQVHAADAEAVTGMHMLAFLLRLALYVVLLLLVIDNIPGVEITALIAGLGIGGIAVALAVQNILADLFASMSITLDKPFVIGDFIAVGEHLGTVENIGLKTTRLRSLTGEQLVFANDDLLRSRLRNFKRMAQRRALFTVRVALDTPQEKLAAIPAMLREIVEAQPEVRFERAHFKEFGEYAMVFEVVFHMLTPDYNRYMDTQQAINLAICARFGRDSIAFAMPARVVHVASGRE
ncbi:MAG: mechanosensitive ion channel family protein [Thiohalomonadaceae bacterium]